MVVNEKLNLSDKQKSDGKLSVNKKLNVNENPNMNKKKPMGRAAKRHQARFFLVQASYQFQLAHTPIHELIAQFQVEHGEASADWPFFSEAIKFIVNNLEEVDKVYQSFLDRDINRLDPIEKSILRLGAYELTERQDIPYRVSINEAVELAKIFGATDSHRYINGIMDKISRNVRALERTS